MASENIVTIGGKDYEISPLRLKHLKQITTLLSKDAPTDVYASLERFYPFITFSIQQKDPSFTVEMIDEGTLAEINNVVNAVIDYSGIKVVAKGEQKPTASSTGLPSTDASVPQSAGITA